MKKLLSLLLVFFSLVVSGQDIPPKPNPPRLVNDVAHVLTADQVSALENKLVAYDDSTSIQIAVVIVQTTGDYAIEDYALKILRDWGVGNKKTNNGLVILAAIKDQKVFIATGYGMEGSVPDITAKEIVENEIVPNFKKGDYYSGLDAASDAIIKASAGEYKAPAGYGGSKKSRGGGSILGIIFIIFIILILISRGGGSSGGGLFSGSGILPFILGSMLGGGGRGGGFSGGGGWSGGGGGGFGGFGGGGGGGGGAGGSW
jgi:uncharacterized protein